MGRAGAEELIMPIYEYDTPEGPQTLLVPVVARDFCPPGWKRRTVPTRIGIVTGLKPPTAESEARKGLRALEERHGTGVFEREMGYTGNQLREIWKED